VPLKTRLKKAGEVAVHVTKVTLTFLVTAPPK
jgi:hypothetical protein